MKKISAERPKVEIEPPGLELGLGYSIIEARPSVKFKISFGAFSRKNTNDRFGLPFWKWWVSFKGDRDRKKGILQNCHNIITSFEEEILRERQLKFQELEATLQIDLANASKALIELQPFQFDSKESLIRIKNQTREW